MLLPDFLWQAYTYSIAMYFCTIFLISIRMTQQGRSAGLNFCSKHAVYALIPGVNLWMMLKFMFEEFLAGEHSWLRFL